MASLDFVRNKVEWAERHRQLLNAEVRNYFSQSVPQMMVEMTPGEVFDQMTVHGPGIPLEIPLIIGDCLQNLRSSLDYLVWELCEAANSTPTEKHQFPICVVRKRYQDASGQQLAGVPKAAQAEIEKLQPFNAAVPESTELWILNRLTNISKHRRILVTDLGAVRTEKARGAVIDRRTQVDHPFMGEMELDHDPVPLIKFGEIQGAGKEVGALLHRLSDYITSEVIPRFETFFT